MTITPPPIIGADPVARVTPFTFREGATLMAIVRRLRLWSLKFGPEVQEIIDNAVAEFKQALEDTQTNWQDLFDEFMADVVAQIAVLNDQAVAQIVGNSSSATYAVLTNLIKSLSLDEAESKTLMFSEILGETKLGNRMYPRALAKVKAIYACSIEEPVYNIFLGSSTTNGAFSSEQMHYPAQITRKVAASIQSKVDPVMFLLSQASGFKQWAKPGLHMANGAVGGMTARNFYTSTQQSSVGNLLNDCRGVVTMMIGSNDQSYGYTPANYKANVQAAIDDIKNRAQKGVAFILVHSFARADKPTFDYPWEAYRDALYEIADADPDNVLMVDLDQHYKKLDVMGTDVFGFASGDLVHNNERSHTFTADWLGKYMELTPGGKRPVQGVTMLDTFTDTNGVSAHLHIPDSYSAAGTYSRANESKWALGTGSSGFEIQNNNLASTGDSGMLYTDVQDADHEISVECIYGSQGTRGVFVRFNPLDNSRFSFYVSGFSVVLSRTSSAGANSTLITAPVSFSVDTNFRLTMRVVGRQILCYFDDKLVISYTMTENLYGLHLGQTCAGVRGTAASELYERAVVIPING